MRGDPLVLGHQNVLVEGFSTSPLDFYAAVEAALYRRQIPDIKFTRVTWRESGILSAERIYLRVTRGVLNFDICAAPFGTGFFFSWWLTVVPALIEEALVLVLFGFIALFTLTSMVTTFFKTIFVGGSSILGLFVLPGLLLSGLFTLGLVIRLGIWPVEDKVLSMPIYVGRLYRFFFKPATYFNQDSEAIFRASVAAAVQECIEAVTEGKGVRATGQAAAPSLLGVLRDALQLM